MDDLAGLLASLDAVQSERSAVKLTERNAVELVQKLFEREVFVRAGEEGVRGNEAASRVELEVGGEGQYSASTGGGAKGASSSSSDPLEAVELLHTSDGKDYMTFDHLVNEVKATLRRMKGRVAVSDLPGILTVDVSHCQRAAAVLIDRGQKRRNHGSTSASDADPHDNVVMLQEELISSAYFDELAGEVVETLRDIGAVSLAELAQRFSLSADVLKSQLEARTADLEGARLEGGNLASPAHTSRLRAAVRGAMRGASRPVAVSSLASREVQAEGGYTASSLAAAAESVVSAGEVDGELKGPTFTPAVCQREAEDRVARYLHDNGIVGKADVKRVCGRRKTVRQWCEARSPGGTMLDTHYVSSSTMITMEVGVEEAAASEEWTDCAALLPADCTNLDVAAALRESAVVAKLVNEKQITIAASCAVSRARMDAFLEEMKRKAAEEAARAVEAIGAKQPPAGAKQSAATASSMDEHDDLKSSESHPPSAASVAQKKSGGGTPAAGRSQRKKGGISLTLSDDDDNDDWDTGPKGKGKKGKKGRRGGGGAPPNANPSAKEGNPGGSSREEAASNAADSKPSAKGKKKKGRDGCGSKVPEDPDRISPPSNETFVDAIIRLDDSLEGVCGGEDNESLVETIVESLRQRVLETFEAAVEDARRELRLKAIQKAKSKRGEEDGDDQEDGDDVVDEATGEAALESIESET